MSNAIEVSGAGKRYTKYEDTPMLISSLRVRARTRRNKLWAVRGIDLEVPKGSTVGLIGRNGSGKTTLMSMMAGVTAPTEGSIRVWGRVAPLIAVGVGFHQELTGRENVYLNGSVLGLTRRQIDARMDAIVAFAEVDDFLDTPVKFYSSGMYVRLGFAVAVHSDPEVLLVDEVLAVGDLEFQKKCLGKMQEVSKSGRTIVFVSHQMNQIRRLCQRVLWLEAGLIHKAGPSGLILGEYEAASSPGQSGADARSNGNQKKTRFLEWHIQGAPPDGPSILTTLGAVQVRFTIEVASGIQCGHHGIALFNSERQLMWAWATERVKLEPGVHELTYTFPGLPLRPGAYSWQVSLWEEGSLLDLWDCTPDMIIATEVHQHPQDQWNGVLNVPCELAIGRSKRK
jgi:lipopolysaccharide transport system ATP-binding protein